MYFDTLTKRKSCVNAYTVRHFSILTKAGQVKFYAFPYGDSGGKYYSSENVGVTVTHMILWKSHAAIVTDNIGNVLTWRPKLLEAIDCDRVMHSSNEFLPARRYASWRPCLCVCLSQVGVIETAGWIEVAFGTGASLDLSYIDS